MLTVSDIAILSKHHGNMMTEANELSTDIHQMDYNRANVFLILFDE